MALCRRSKVFGTLSHRKCAQPDFGKKSRRVRNHKPATSMPEERQLGMIRHMRLLKLSHCGSSESSA